MAAFKRWLSLGRRISTAANSKGAIRASSAASRPLLFLRFRASVIPYCSSILALLIAFPRFFHGNVEVRTQAFDTLETMWRRLKIDRWRGALCHHERS